MPKYAEPDGRFVNVALGGIDGGDSKGVAGQVVFGDLYKTDGGTEKRGTFIGGYGTLWLSADELRLGTADNAFGFTGVIRSICDAKLVDGRLRCSYNNLSFYNGILMNADYITVKEDNP